MKNRKQFAHRVDMWDTVDKWLDSAGVSAVLVGCDYFDRTRAEHRRRSLGARD